ncbi:MAG: hypothetical protein HQK98_04965 [Nitrospirae bacterium]|nr:hypothetical protein [Nitrospirota bacterium]
MVIQEVYLSYVWSIIYWLLVVYEEDMEKQHKEYHRIKMSSQMTHNQIIKEVIKYTNNTLLINPLIQNTIKLVEWAVTLADKYSDHDINLPNPEKPNTDEEKFYVEKTNAIFQDAIAYIMYHECMHLIYNHQYDKNDDTYNKELEKEADSSAFKFIMDNEENQDNFQKGLSIVIANVILLFRAHPSDIVSKRHPDTDIRIITCIDYFGEEFPRLDAIKYIVSLAFELFFRIYDIPYKVERANDINELLNIDMVIFDDLKKQDVIRQSFNKRERIL